EPALHRARIAGRRRPLRADLFAVRAAPRRAAVVLRQAAPPGRAKSRRGGCRSMSRNLMRAIILAAGRGSRLENVAGDVPKCLAPMGAATLLDRQIRSLKSAGVTDVVVVTGYRADMIHDLVGGAATC